MNVRCKMTCTKKEAFADGFHVEMQPVYQGSKENEEFYLYTPGGQLQLTTVNPRAAEALVEGQEYYVDITPAAEAG